MTETTIITKTDETKDKYRKRAKSLMHNLRDFKNNLKDKDKYSQDEFILMWFKHIADGKSKSTFRQYKAAFIQHCVDRGMDDFIDILKKTTREQLSEISPPINKLTSAKKSKKISAKDKDKLDEFFLKLIKSRNNCLLQVRTHVMYSATYIVGLRPTEWRSAEIIENCILKDGTILALVLKVRNAKDTNDRANGKYRHIDLSEIKKDDLLCIKRNIKLIKEHLSESKMNGKDECKQNKNPYDSYHKSCSDQLAHAHKKLWPRRKTSITLYTFRHQFAANYKFMGYSKVEIAALMGHVSDATAAEHYGKKSAGRKGGFSVVNPISSEVQTVRIKHKPFPFAQKKGSRLN